MGWEPAQSAITSKAVAERFQSPAFFRSVQAPVRRRGERRRLDIANQQDHNRVVVPNRLSIPDARGQGASLRVTRHPELE